MSQTVLDTAVDQLHDLLGADGLKFIVEGHVPGSRLDLRMNLDAVECMDCIMPGEYLTAVVEDAVREILSEPTLVVKLEDPRAPGSNF